MGENGMLKEFDIDDEAILPVCVMATMSSGKSTFLNAILGEEILPEKNEACTARALAVIHTPGMREPRAYIQKQDGKKYAVDLFYPGTVAKINADEKVESVLIAKDIPSVENTDRSVVFVDTPGVNNSEDIRHAQRTQQILERMKRGVIVYILNATQLATNDDELLLQMVIGHVKKNADIRVLFMLNKVDMLDEDKENIGDVICAARAYIKDHGLKDSRIFPLSALSAKVLRMKLNGKKMTRAEQRHLEQVYPEYRVSGKSMLQYMDSYHRCGGSYEIGGEAVSEYALRRAVENTGITEIERQIQREVLSFLKRKSSGPDSLLTYPVLKGVYARRRKTANYAGYSGKVLWYCKKCKQVNGDNRECLNCGQPNVRWTTCG